MKIQKGIVKYKDRNDIVCTYGVTDDGRQYYFLDETDSKKFANGNRVATTALVEAIDPMIKASNVGVIDNDGNVIVMFDNRSVKPINDNIILVEKANPISQSVIDAINLRSDPLSATKLVSTPATIKERLNAQMGSEGRYIFNDQFSEATLYDINGNNLLNGEYYSFMAIANEKIYMSKNTADSVINEMPLGSPVTFDEQAIDVSAVSVDANVVENALQQGMENAVTDAVNTDVQNNFESQVGDTASQVNGVVVDGAPIEETVAEAVPAQVEDALVGSVVTDNSLYEGMGVAAQEGYPMPGDGVDTVVENVLEGTLENQAMVGDGSSALDGFENVSVPENNQVGFSQDEIVNDMMSDSIVADNQVFAAQENMMSEDINSGLVEEAVAVGTDLVNGNDVVASEAAVTYVNDMATGFENGSLEEVVTENEEVETQQDNTAEEVPQEDVAEPEIPQEEVVEDRPQEDVAVENAGVEVEAQDDLVSAKVDVAEEVVQEEAVTNELVGDVTLPNEEVVVDMPPIVEDTSISAEATEEVVAYEEAQQEDAAEETPQEDVSGDEAQQEEVDTEAVPQEEVQQEEVAEEAVTDVEEQQEVEAEDLPLNVNLGSEEDTSALEDIKFNDSLEDVVRDASNDIVEDKNDFSSLIESNNKPIDDYVYDDFNNDYSNNRMNNVERTYYDRDSLEPVGANDYLVPPRGNTQYSTYDNNYDTVFKSSLVKPDRIVTSYNPFAGYKNSPLDNSSIMTDVAKSMTELMRQNKEQRGVILQFQEKLEEVEAQRRVLSDKYNDQTLRVESLSSKLRSIDDVSTRLETKNQMLENRIREQEKLIAAQERELSELRPQLEGRQDLIKILADAKALLGSDDEYQEDSYYGRRVA